MSYRIRDCPLCGGHDFSPLLKARDFHYGNPGEYSLAGCTGCSLAFLDPMYEDAELSKFYPRDYYSFANRCSTPTVPPLRGTIHSLLRIEGVQTKDPKFEKPGRMLDVGCGSGWFLTSMREQGWKVMGVEPSLAAARLGQSEEGLDIFPGSLLDAAFPAESFDYVRLNHSFEHMSDPNRILAEVHRILAKDGKLMIGVPNRASLNANLFGPFWWHLALPLHTYSYSSKTLSQMLVKHSFKIEKVIFNTDWRGIQGSLQMFLNRHDEPLSSQGRILASRLALLLCTWAAYLQNLFHVADVIEITATK